MAEFILVRHGESFLNKENVYFGWSDSPLTDKGYTQILNIKNKILNYDRIISSPLKRTYESAKILNFKNLKIQTDDRLKEINFGIFENLTYKEILENYPNETIKWKNLGIKYQYIQGESILDMFNRVFSFIEEFKNLDETIILVTHFGVINVVLSYYITKDISNFWNFKCNLGTITTINFTNNFPILKNFSIK